MSNESQKKQKKKTKKKKQAKQVTLATSTFISMFAGKYSEIKQCDFQQ